MNDIIVIDNFTIIISVVIFLFVIGASFFSPFVRYRRKREEIEGNQTVEAETTDDQSDRELPQLSVILTPHDETDMLEANLPYILKQHYPAGFQVIVVVDQGDHDTADVIKRLMAEQVDKPGDGSLYMTYIPDSSRYLSRKKFAMTLGVKAARTEWVLFTEAYCRPVSDNWLSTMASNCSDSTHVVIGYGNYESSTKTFRRFERLNTAHYLMREDRKGMPYTTLSHNIMLRKSDFMQQDSFLGNLNLIRGEYDFLVNKYAVEGGTALETRSDAWVTDAEPTRKSWFNKHIFYAETRLWMARSKSHRFWFNLDHTMLHASLLLAIAGIVYGALATNVIVLLASAVALVVSIIVRTLNGWKAMKAFDETVAPLLIYPFELSLIWHNLGYSIRHRYADKYDFTTHKQ